ncbi:MAG: putative DNA binding domain-containing protein [Opitutaceae bacterium]|nr:putative DNA binding domain-containing protein [Opitutaceae bacterium]
MTPLELLQELNDLDEHSRVEAKTAGDVGKSLLETVCAFANEPGLDGGWIVLGARLDEGALFRQYTAVGVADPDKLSRDVATQCATVFNRPVRVQIEAGLVNGRTLLAIRVPEAAPAEKPVFFQSRALPGAAFRRIGSADVHCTDDDLAIFYQERRGESFDSTIVRDADFTAFDSAALADYRRLRAEANATAEELKWNDQELLHALRCVSPDGGTLRPTVAGILLFGTTAALRRYFPLMRVDYIRVPGRDWVQDPDRRFETIELRAPLITLIRRARAAILDDLPKAFSLPAGQLHRQDLPLVPDRVIREAVVNAVMHRSYRVQGATQIIRYSNRLEIRNAGHSLVAEDRLGEPGSETRNPVIAAVLHETNLAETKGSGIRVMRELMASAGLTPPTFESDRERNQFVVTFLFHHFLTPDDWQWLGQFTEVGLSDEEARALVFVREMGAINNAAYRHLNRVDVLNASQHLRRLRDHGLLRQKGKSSETYYQPTPKLVGSPPAPGEPGPALPPGAKAISDNLPPVSDKPPALSANPPPLSVNPPPQSVNPVHRYAAFPGLPPALEQALTQLKARVAQPEMEDLVWQLSAWKALSTDELATLLGRNRTYVTNRLVTPMLRAGRLAMTIPDQPNHPDQRYRAVVK